MVRAPLMTPDDPRSAAAPLLEVEGVSKAFPGVQALDHVAFRLKPGSVHALMGENGAGKSTLMKIIAGIYAPDHGTIRLKGEAVRLHSPRDALEKGIAMIHQELNLMPFMTVAENIWIRREPLGRFGFVDHAALRRKTAALLADLKIDIDPEINIDQLSIASRQMVEIAKAVSFNSDVLIMDEPTSALTEREVEHLFQIIRDLKAKGKGIVYITHKMNELFAIADEVSVFRDGAYIGTRASAATSRDEIIRMMVGREITQLFPKQAARIGDVVLSVRDLALDGVFENISFDVHAGEILGVAGLVGSGRSNVAEAIFGVVPPTSGTIAIRGRPVRITSPADALKAGMAFLTEDRKETGCFLLLDVLENMQAALLSQNHVRFNFVDQNAVTRVCEAMRESLRIKTPSLYERVENLSGGNQQKTLIGRWLLTRPKILILDEPTRGIDVGAKAEIHRLISALAGEGVAVIMISSEMPEILGMSDRILVMHNGRTTGLIDRDGADQVKIMELASS